MSAAERPDAVALIGFGEVGRTLAAGVRDACGDGLRIGVHDPAFADLEAAGPLHERAEQLDVEVMTVEGLRAYDLVLSVVTPAAAMAAAKGFAAHAHADQLLVDLNSTTPAVKREIATSVADSAGARVVDGVLTGGGIALDGFGIPVKLAGPDADEAADRLRALGLNAKAVGTEIGAAAAVKMIRGVVMKGLEALVVEALLAAEHHGVRDEVVESVANTFDVSDGEGLIEMLARTHLVHCVRRSVEARMIAATVGETGLHAIMSDATQAFFERSAASGITGVVGTVVPEHSREGLRQLARLLHDTPGEDEEDTR